MSNEIQPVGTPSPYAVFCNHGILGKPQKCYLTTQEYTYQMNRPNSLWECPLCGREAFWDDLNYEEWMEKSDMEQHDNEDIQVEVPEWI